MLSSPHTIIDPIEEVLNGREDAPLPLASCNFVWVRGLRVCTSVCGDGRGCWLGMACRDVVGKAEGVFRVPLHFHGINNKSVCVSEQFLHARHCFQRFLSVNSFLPPNNSEVKTTVTPLYRGDE